jgi:phage-related protein
MNDKINKFKVTPKIKKELRKEIKSFLASKGLKVSDIRQPQKATGIPVAWRYLNEFLKYPAEEITAGAETVFKLYSFFGYELEFKKLD